MKRTPKDGALGKVPTARVFLFPHNQRTPCTSDLVQVKSAYDAECTFLLGVPFHFGEWPTLSLRDGFSANIVPMHQLGWPVLATLFTPGCPILSGCRGIAPWTCLLTGRPLSSGTLPANQVILRDVTLGTPSLACRSPKGAPDCRRILEWRILLGEGRPSSGLSAVFVS